MEVSAIVGYAIVAIPVIGALFKMHGRLQQHENYINDENVVIKELTEFKSSLLPVVERLKQSSHDMQIRIENHSESISKIRDIQSTSELRNILISIERFEDHQRNTDKQMDRLDSQLKELNIGVNSLVENQAKILEAINRSKI